MCISLYSFVFYPLRNLGNLSTHQCIFPSHYFLISSFMLSSNILFECNGWFLQIYLSTEIFSYSWRHFINFGHWPIITGSFPWNWSWIVSLVTHYIVDVNQCFWALKTRTRTVVHFVVIFWLRQNMKLFSHSSLSS